MRRLVVALLVILLAFTRAEANVIGAANRVNARSGIGTNLSGGPSPQEQPFLNAMKLSGGWTTRTASNADTGETPYLYASCLDANGYPPHLPCQTTTTCIGGTGGVSSTTLTITSCSAGPGFWTGGTVTGSGIGAGVTLTNVQSAATNATTASGNSVLHFVSVPAGVVVGSVVTDSTTPSAIPGGDQVVAVTATTVTIGTAAAGAGVGSGDTIVFTGNFQGGLVGTYTLSSAQTVANGTTITEAATFTQLSAFMLSMATNLSLPGYPGGNGSWLLLYDGDDNAGSSNFEYHNDATLGSHACMAGTCTDTLNVTQTQSGIRFFLDFTDVNTNGKYVKNIRLVQTAQYNALSAGDKAAFNACCTVGSTAGIYFNPDWIAQVKQFRGFRFMDWNETNSNANSSWATRPTPNWVSWSDLQFYAVVPLEVMIALSNQLGAHPWINMPCLADSNYFTQAATMTLNLLASGLQVIEEVCNEAWNFNFTDHGGGLNSLILTGLRSDQSYFTSCVIGFDCLLANYTKRSVAAADIWNGIWTGANNARLFPILGGHLGDNAKDVFVLGLLSTYAGGNGTAWAGTAGTHVKAVADAFYFGQRTFNAIPNAWTGDIDGGFTRFAKQLTVGGLFPTANVSGNCGNGAGISCGGPTAFTLTTGLSLTNSTVTNGQCIAFTSNAASSGSITIGVDSVSVIPLKGNDNVAIQLANATQYAICYTNAMASVATGASVGAGGSGYTNGSQVLTIVGGNCLVAPSFNVTVSGNAVTAVNSVANAGYCPTTPANNAATTGGGGTGATLNVTYPAFTTSWQVADIQAACGSELACLQADLTTGKNTANAQTPPVLYFGYEGGQDLFEVCQSSGGGHWCGSPGSGNAVQDRMFTLFQNSIQMADVYAQMLPVIKNAGMIELYQFTDPGVWIDGTTYWGFNPGTYAAISPTTRQTALYQYMQSTPCWWAGC